MQILVISFPETDSHTGFKWLEEIPCCQNHSKTAYNFYMPFHTMDTDSLRMVYVDFFILSVLGTSLGGEGVVLNVYGCLWVSMLYNGVQVYMHAVLPVENMKKYNKFIWSLMGLYLKFQ